MLFESLIGPRALPYLADHRIYGSVVLPATAYLEMGLAAGEETLGPGVHVLEDVVISEAMVLPATQDRLVQVRVSPQDDGAAIEVRSRGADGGEEWRLHASGRVREAEAPCVPETLEDIRARCTTELPVEAQYEALRGAGIDFGPSFRGLVGLWAGDGEALGRVRLPEAASQGTDGYRVHPALLDACFQALGGALTRGDGPAGVYLPLSLERVGLHARAEADVWSHVRIRPEAAASGETVVADIWVLDEAGQAVAQVEGLRLARATPEALRRVTEPSVDEWLHEVAWRAQPLAEAARATRPARAGSWLILADADGIGDALAQRWAERGERILVVRPGPEFAKAGDGAFRLDPARPDDFRRLVREASVESRLEGVVHLWNLGALSGEDGSALRRATALGCGSLLHLAQALAELRQTDSPRLWVVTRGAQAVAGSPAGPGLAQAPTWGLARTLAAEHPELQPACVDLDAGAGGEASEPLRAEIEAGSSEDQVAYRAGRRYVARLVHRPSSIAADGQPLELEIATRGILDELRLRPTARRRPGPGEVEIRVVAAALNFRDVLNAMGVYEGPPGPLGSECAGRIVALGEGVQDLVVGQEVVAMTAGAFRTHVTTAAAFVVAKPEALSFEEAAAAPVAFLTAEYSLNRLGVMKAGDRVLIHAGTGGVGLAAVQLAQRAGAEVFATAGSDEKRAYLKSLGVAHVMDSRSLSFADAVMKASGGEGVDLVLNSLTGDFIPKSLGLLRRGGRFLEIGKAGIWSVEQMSAARDDVSYFPIYLGGVEPAQLRSMLLWLMEEFDSAALKPLPVRAFPMAQASSGFRFMAQAKHIGKIVLTDGAGTPAVRPDATYLITGGLGSLGLLAAGWMVERGARRLVLAGRGAPSPSAREALGEMERAGAEVVFAQGDVSDEAFIPRLMAEAAGGRFPLRGVVHAAGVLDDGVLVQQSWERFERVLAPKAAGAWNLHLATRGMPLDFFVLFSSAASLLGSPGQGNYAAANAYLDALAHHRRGEGLPALSINWGPWADVGMAAGLDARDQARMTRQGLRSLSPEEGLAAFARLLGQASAQVGVLPLDLAKILAPFPPGSEPPLLAELAQGLVRQKGPKVLSARPELVVQVEQAPAGRRRGLVLAHVRSHVLGVLGLDPSSAPDPQQGLRDLGMDSLMAIELRNRLQRSVGESLPPTVAFDFPTIEALTDYLLEHVPALGSGSTETPVAVVAPLPFVGAHTGEAEPIAIIGLGCRFPGAGETPQAYWKLLRDGVDAIREVPSDRWDIDACYDADPDAPGKMYTRHGGFIEDVDTFDSHFFGISPREAVSLDPQHRMLLEVSWEALERAGQSPDRLMGSRTGVFIGISSNDYALMQFKAMEHTGISAYFGIGSAASAAAGRLSYFLGLQGPCLAVDTACSSSLVAVHLACQSLRQGECRAALVAGVNLILTPEVTVNFCRARMLAADGRCKTFDAAADGYVRSEGCGAVVLKRLSDAIADGDPVLAVIRGSAVNQDGRSGGLTVPNGPAQEALIREALAMAGVAPAEVGYVEAHGTGTSLGDPIEMKALGAVMGEGRSAERPLVVGSVKTNMGHLEAAAGVAGLIKVVLSLQHGEIPPHLHYRELNPHISLREIPAVIPTSLVSWPRGNGRRIAGISSFGFAGTNAHLVVGEAPEAPPAVVAQRERPRHLLALSAKTEGALVALAARFAEALTAESSASLADLTFSNHTGRGQFAHRLALVAETPADAAGPLAAFAAGESPAAVIRGEVLGREHPEVAFLFTGQGSQYVGMGRELYETQPTFRKALERCEELLRGQLDRPLLSVMYPKDGETSPLDETEYTQPCLFALEWALAEMWRSFGVEPSAVMGHSVGEYVAACVAGVFSLEDGLKLVAARGRLMQALPSGGAMAAVSAGEERVMAAIATSGASVSIAAVNGPASVVVSGAERDLARVLGELEREGVRTKRLVVSHAFHSDLMDPVLGDLERVAGEVSYSAPRIALVSNVTGEVIRDEVANAGYWRRHAREAVRFAAGTVALWGQGYRVFVEVGPSPTLLGMGRQCVGEEEALWLPTLRAPRDEWSQVLESLGRLYVAGVSVDWAGFDQDYPRRKVLLPTYPFQRQRHWIETAAPASRLAPPPDRTPELYEVAWQPAPRVGGTADAPEGPGTWLVFADAAGVAATLTRRLEEQGQRTVVVWPGERYEAGPAGSIRLDPARPEDFDRLWREVVEAVAPLRGVVHLWSLDDPAADVMDSSSLDQANVRGCATALHLLRQLAKGAGGVPPRLWLVTRGAQPAGGPRPLAVSQTPLWGLARTIAVEHPELRCMCGSSSPPRRRATRSPSVTGPASCHACCRRRSRGRRRRSACARTRRT